MQLWAGAVLRDIIKTWMVLNDNQIWIYNEEKNINNNQLNVVIQVGSMPSYSNNIETGDIVDPDNSNQTIFAETITNTKRETYQIDIFAYDTIDNTNPYYPNEAMNRHQEIEMALLSTYSQTQQEKYSFKIAKMGTSINTSSLEGSAFVKRYTISIECLTWYVKVNPIDYYDNFTEPTYLIEQ